MWTWETLMKFFRPRKISNILAVFRESREEPNFHSLALDLCFRVLGLFCFLFCFFYSLLKVCGFSSLLLSGRENVMWYTVNYDLFLFLCPFIFFSPNPLVFFSFLFFQILFLSFFQSLFLFLGGKGSRESRKVTTWPAPGAEREADDLVNS